MARIRRQAAEWAELIDQWRQSGLSLPAFCQRHGLSRGSMQNWVYKPELKRAVEEVREQLEYVPASMIVLRHVRPKYACKDCQGNVMIAERLPEPIEKGLPGPGLLA